MASERLPADRVRRVAASFLKIFGVLAAVVVAIVAAAAAFVSSRHFTAAVESELVKAMQAKHRTLKFDGPLEIFFWPNAGFKAGRVALSEPNSAKEFASLDAAAFSVAVAPLFAGRVAIGECAVDGLKAALVRHRDGTLNIDDLLAPTEPSAANVSVELAACGVRNAMLSWTDEAAGSSIVVHGVDLSGRDIRVETGAKTIGADDVSLAAALGDARLRLDFGGLAASPAALKADRVGLDVAYESAGAAVKGTLSAHLAADLEHGTAALEDLAGSVDVDHPRLAHPVKLAFKGALRASRDSADGSLAAHVDESNASLKLRVTRFSPPALRFDADVDRLDVGRYLAPARAEEGEAKKASPIDLSALKGLELDGTARIGSLEIAGIKTRNIRLEIRGEHGKLDVRSVAGAK